MINEFWDIPFKKVNIPKEFLAEFTPLLSLVLALKGINSLDEADAFINPSYSDINNPFLFKDMDKAVERTRKAVELGEHVAVYGDYDVDGITSASIVADYLRDNGLTTELYIPCRDEGYGLNNAAIDSLREKGVSLIITVDCGITAVDEVKHASEIGVDIVITDHHECGSRLPEAYAVVNAKRPDDSYPFKDLAGVGTALKYICACETGFGSLSQSDIINKHIDLVAIGTIADIMPLQGENRYFVKYGLESINHSHRPAIQALSDSLKSRQKITSTTIGYNIAPKLNATGRMGKAFIASELLLSKSRADADLIVKELTELNNQRRATEQQIFEEAVARISQNGSNGQPIILADDTWHQGVIGIVASKIAEKYNVPAIIINTEKDDIGKGSCRSVGRFNLFEALKACSEHLMSFGGHALAAGINIRRDKIAEFNFAMQEYYLSHLPEPEAKVKCDLVIYNPEMLSIESIQSLDLLEPYGNCNSKILMCLYDVSVISVSSIGADKSHTKLEIDFKGNKIDAVFFSHSADSLKIHSGDRIDIAFNPQINTFRSNSSVQLVLTDLRLHRPYELCYAIVHQGAAVIDFCSRYLPGRNECASAWRVIRMLPVLPETLDDILALTPPDMCPESFVLSLLVFKDLNLLQCSNGTILGAVPVKDTKEKRSLDSSVFYKR